MRVPAAHTEPGRAQKAWDVHWGHFSFTGGRSQEQKWLADAQGLRNRSFPQNLLVLLKSARQPETIGRALICARLKFQVCFNVTRGRTSL